MEQVLHLFIINTCRHKCPLCCNKFYDIEKIPVVTVERLKSVDTVCLTGGEPLLLRDETLYDFVVGLREQYPNIKNLYVYTSGKELSAKRDTVEVLVKNSLINGVNVSPKDSIDWMGLAALFFVGFGWGQPVQINPYNFRNRRRDEFLVSIAGVVMNLLLAVVFTVIIKILIVAGAGVSTAGFAGSLWTCLQNIVVINLVLMIFNLIPVPPLDGFNIIAQIFNFGQKEVYWKIYQYGNWLLVILIVTGITGLIISPCVNFMYSLLVNLIIY